MRLNWHIPLPGPFSVGGSIGGRRRRGGGGGASCITAPFVLLWYCLIIVFWLYWWMLKGIFWYGGALVYRLVTHRPYSVPCRRWGGLLW